MQSQDLCLSAVNVQWGRHLCFSTDLKVTGMDSVYSMHTHQKVMRKWDHETKLQAVCFTVSMWLPGWDLFMRRAQLCFYQMDKISFCYPTEKSVLSKKRSTSKPKMKSITGNNNNNKKTPNKGIDNTKITQKYLSWWKWGNLFYCVKQHCKRRLNSLQKLPWNAC